MALDRSFVERNRAATQRIRDLAASWSDNDFQRRVGEHWTVGALHRNEHLDDVDAVLKG